jgi:leucyl aminopeptidase (aminopeptidase T)
MTTAHQALNGARKIIQHCLGLGNGHELLILADETTVAVAMILAEAARQLGVSQTTLLVPMEHQRRIPGNLKLSLPTWTVAKDARAILTCVNGAPDCFPFRDYILDNWRSARTRIGHMPGASLDILTLANVDFDKLIGACRRLELAMARGRQLDFYSTSADGTRHRLMADIGGWERLPVASDGVIDDGIWGNVPSGETYIAPIEGSAEGSVVINGSIPDRLLRPGEEIMLRFAAGRVVGIEPADSPAVRWLIETHIEPARLKEDPNWNNLAEIGVGVNPAVKALTGNMLFDEKSAGTAHIALGSNTFMGGQIESSIHCDMVVRNPVILIDERPIVADGRLQIAEADWRQNLHDVSLADSPLRKASQVMRSGEQTTIAENGHLWRVLRSDPGRLSQCMVGDEETALLARSVYDRLPEGREWISIDTLVRRTKLSTEIVRRVLHILWDYALIQIRP